MYYGAGFTHSDVYNMPIYLRNFYYKKLVDTRKKENDEIKKQKLSSKEKQALKNPKIQKLLKGFYKDLDNAKKHSNNVRKELEKLGIKTGGQR